MAAPKNPNTQAARFALAAKRAAERNEARRAELMAYFRELAAEKDDPELSALVAELDRKLFPVDLAQLTRFLGLPDHEQSAVLAWSGESLGHIWTVPEAADLAKAWAADAARIAAER